MVNKCFLSLSFLPNFVKASSQLLAEAIHGKVEK